MTCQIETGRKEVSLGGIIHKETGSGALFDLKSTKLTSYYLHLEACKAIQFSTFGLPDGAYLTLHRVLTTDGRMPQGAGCICDYDNGAGVDVSASEPLKVNCKPVVLDNCNTVLYLAIPGSYMLELNREEYLGQFWAFAEEVDCCCLPDGLVIGNRSGNSYIGVKG